MARKTFTRKDYLSKLDSIIAAMETEIDNAPKRGKKVSFERDQIQDFLEYFRELTDMYSEGLGTIGQTGNT